MKAICSQSFCQQRYSATFRIFEFKLLGGFMEVAYPQRLCKAGSRCRVCWLCMHWKTYRRISEKTIFAKVFPTLAQIVLRLRTQHPSSSSFRHLDIALVGFVHGTEKTITLSRLRRSERNWVSGRCRLFGLEYQFARTIGGKGLILMKRDRWVYDGDTKICKLIWCKTRWRYRCESCDLATNLDLKKVFVRPFLCPMCVQVAHPFQLIAIRRESSCDSSLPHETNHYFHNCLGR